MILVTDLKQNHLKKDRLVYHEGNKRPLVIDFFEKRYDVCNEYGDHKKSFSKIADLKEWLVARDYLETYLI